jgi:hypothetical protein
VRLINNLDAMTGGAEGLFFVVKFQCRKLDIVKAE